MGCKNCENLPNKYSKSRRHFIFKYALVTSVDVETVNLLSTKIYYSTNDDYISSDLTAIYKIIQQHNKYVFTGYN